MKTNNRCPLLNIPLNSGNSITILVNNEEWIISRAAHNIISQISLPELQTLVDNWEQKIIEQKIHENRKSTE